jgi:RsiW-degrading membrane proteinase PrsW (M82 family)
VFFILLAVSIMPVFLIALILYLLDKEKESVGTMFKYYALGLLSAGVVLFIDLFLPTDFVDSYFTMFIYAFIVIAMVEEGAKFGCMKLGLSFEKSYNNFYDSIIFSTAVSLGFAGIENVLYVLGASFQSTALGLGTGLLRAFLAIPGHAIFAIYMGFFLYKAMEAKAKGKSTGTYYFLSLFLPIVLHGTYDFLCFAMGIAEGPLLFLLFCIFVIFMYVSGIVLVVLGVKKSHLAFHHGAPVNAYSGYAYNGYSYNNYNNYSNPVNNYVDPNQGFITCSNCGKVIQGTFCGYCGTNNAPQVNTYNPYQSAVKTCHFCGMTTDGAFCPRCGSPV